jgi:hypothetical protein
MWVIMHTGFRPKYGAGGGRALAQSIPVRGLGVYRTEAAADAQLRRLENWAATGVGQSYRATMLPTYGVRADDLDPAGQPAGPNWAGPPSFPGGDAP